jgi:hypothetical protein
MRSDKLVPIKYAVRNLAACDQVYAELFQDSSIQSVRGLHRAFHRMVDCNSKSFSNVFSVSGTGGRYHVDLLRKV